MIPFLDLKQLNARFESQFKKQFEAFLDKGWYVLGDQVTQFEQAYARYCGTRYCVSTANGLDALRLILEGYKIQNKLQPGDEVLIASNTYIATILGVLQSGLKPVLVEAEATTFNFNFADLSRRVTPQTKVIMPTHLYGQLCDMQKVNAFAKAHKLLVVTDAAQSHGAIADSGKRSGSLADASGHSFYPTKNLGALGDGGAITTDDQELAQCLRALRNYGFEKRYVSRYLGLNSRLDEIQAAFLNIKLKSLDADNEQRRAIARRYLEEIKNPAITLPFWDGSPNHVFHLFVIQTKKRDALAAYLKDAGIGTIIHYPVAPHQQEALSDFAHLEFPVTEQLHSQVLSLPISPMLTVDQVSYIIEQVNAF